MVAREKVALPARPEDSVAAAHEEAVSGVFGGVRVVDLGGIVEEVDEELGAAVVDVVDEAAVAFGHVGGFEHEEVGGVFDEAVGVAGGVLDVDDGGEGWGIGVYGEVNATNQLFVGAYVAEGDAVGEGGAGVDVEADLDRVGVWHLPDLLGHRAWTPVLRVRTFPLGLEEELGSPILRIYQTGPERPRPSAYLRHERREGGSGTSNAFLMWVSIGKCLGFVERE